MNVLRRRMRGPIAFWSLAGLALLLSHDAVFLVQLGPGEALTAALRDAAHGYWGAASLIVAAIAAISGAGAAARLLVLRRQARQLGATGKATHRPFGQRLLLTWACLFALVAAGFVVQESLEHLAMHSHAIGLGALVGPEYPLALPVLGLVTLAAALVATLIAGTERALLAAIAAGLHRLATRAPRRLVQAPIEMGWPRIPVLARAAAGRAPPRVLVLRT